MANNLEEISIFLKKDIFPKMRNLLNKSSLDLFLKYFLEKSDIQKKDSEDTIYKGTSDNQNYSNENELIESDYSLLISKLQRININIKELEKYLFDN